MKSQAPSTARLFVCLLGVAVTVGAALTHEDNERLFDSTQAIQSVAAYPPSAASEPDLPSSVESASQLVNGSGSSRKTQSSRRRRSPLSRLQDRSCVRDIFPVVSLKNHTFIRFTSPGFPNNYPSNFKCGWKIHAPENQAIRMLCPRFDLGKDDILAVSDMGSKEHIIFDGSTHKINLTSTTNSLFVGFRSRRSSPFNFGFMCIARTLARFNSTMVHHRYGKRVDTEAAPATSQRQGTLPTSTKVPAPMAEYGTPATKQDQDTPSASAKVSASMEAYGTPVTEQDQVSVSASAIPNYPEAMVATGETGSSNTSLVEGSMGTSFNYSTSESSLAEDAESDTSSSRTTALMLRLLNLQPTNFNNESVEISDSYAKVSFS